MRFRSGRRRSSCAERKRCRRKWVGLKFFNVFGANEGRKGDMMSLVAKRFEDAKKRQDSSSCSNRTVMALPTASKNATSSMSTTPYSVVRWLLDTPSVSGIFNVGTGEARSFRDLMLAPLFGDSVASRRLSMSICRSRSAAVTSISLRLRD